MELCMKKRILITFRPTEPVLNRLKQEFDAVVLEQSLPINQLLEEINKQQSEAVVIGPAYKFSADVMKALPPSVKIVATSSVGFDHMDVAAAKERGILLSNTPDVLTDCTADLGMMLLLNACRRGREYQEIMDAGWRKSFGQADMLGLQVTGKTLGILGMGRIGRALADRARGFGIKILYCNNRQLTPDLEKGATYFKKFEDMLPHCQFLSLNAPSTPETKGIMNEKTFALLPDNAVLINVGRGNLVDENAMMKALDSKKLFAAGLDVFAEEPNYNLKLKEYHQVFLTPHMGSATIETRSAMGQRALDNVAAALNNQKPPDSLY
jgi:lactate dehydrogenase-like 2-hydroxyacid dehydrogenase